MGSERNFALRGDEKAEQVSLSGFFLAELAWRLETAAMIYIMPPIPPIPPWS